MKKIAIFSIDGVLADINHRFYHSSYQCNCGSNMSFKSHIDSLNNVVYNFYQFFKYKGYHIYIFSERSEKQRNNTEKWLQTNNISFEKLEMRCENDCRPSYLVKQDFLFKNFQLPVNTNIQAVFDHDISSIQMYKLHNIKKIYYY